MAELHTEQLEYLINRLAQQSCRVDAVGLFPANLAPRIARSRIRDTCFIMNTDAQGQPGTHWLAFYYDCAKDVLEYFDSFGAPLSFYFNVSQTLAKRKIPIQAVNTHPLQSLTSAACGYYCVLYLHLRTWQGGHMYAVTRLRKLARDANVRDAAAINTMHKLMHTYRCDALPSVSCCTRFSQSCTCWQ